jgi:NAD(P)H-dependent FMN reductase
MARPLEYHDHSESSSLLARGEHLLAQTTNFEVCEFPLSNLPTLDRPPQAQAHEHLSEFGSAISAIDKSCIQLSASRLLSF